MNGPGMQAGEARRKHPLTFQHKNALATRACTDTSNAEKISKNKVSAPYFFAAERA